MFTGGHRRVFKVRLSNPLLGLLNFAFTYRLIAAALALLGVIGCVVLLGILSSSRFIVALSNHLLNIGFYWIHLFDAAELLDSVSGILALSATA